MARFRRIGVLPAALVALVLVATPTARADDIVDFKDYPAGAQACLYSASDSSQCESQTVVATNSCFCRNGGDFVTKAAACIGKSSPDDLKATYQQLKLACSYTATPVSITEDEFMEAAAGSETTTTSSTKPTKTSSTDSATSAATTGTTATTSTTPSTTPSSTAPTSSSTASPDNKDKQGSSGLSTGALAGIIVGVVGALGLLGAVAFILFRRRRKGGEESHPMLPQQAHHSIGPSAASDGSTAYYNSPPPDSGAWPKKDWGASPDLRSSKHTSGFNWESPSHLAYPASALAPSPPLPVQELDGDGTQRFRPGSTQAPVEMGGTPVITTPPPPQNGQHQPYPAPDWGQAQR